MRVVARIILGAASFIAAGTAFSQTTLDISLPWGPTEFHTVNAQNFAAKVAEATGGAVKMTVHPGGALGIKANESVRALEDGTVAMAEFAGFQNVGEVPLLGIESLPFLVDDYDQLRQMHAIVRPKWEAALAQRGVRVLYVVPWPSQNFFLKKQANTIEDLKGVRMRTYDRLTAEMVSRIGMVPQQMNNPDIVPALASGRLDAVMTSGTTAVAQKYWEFLKYTYNTNHLWASNFMAIGERQWAKIAPEHQKKILALAAEMEPEFWKVSQAEHAKRMDQLRQNGMTVETNPKALIDPMKKVTRPLWDDFGKQAGPDAAKVLQDYMARTGRQ